MFHDYDFHALQEHQRGRMAEAIDQADADMLRRGDTDAIADVFVRQFRIDVPELIEGAISLTVDEAEVDVTGDPLRGFLGPGPHYVPGIRATYYVPYRGDRELFKCRPSTRTTVVPAAEVTSDELSFTFERADQDVAATKNAFDQELSRVNQYLGWLREDAATFNQSLPSTARQRVAARKSRLAQMEQGVRSLGVPVRPASGKTSAPSVHVVAARPGPAEPAQRYDVALSFAGEDRAYVEEVAKELRDSGVNVFYDAFEKANLWGKNLIDHLAEVYHKRSRYVVMFISEHYVKKAWPTHERTHAQARALVAKEEYILPARFDDTEVPGMTTTVGYVDLRKTALAALVELVLVKLGRRG